MLIGRRRSHTVAIGGILAVSSLLSTARVLAQEEFETARERVGQIQVLMEEQSKAVAAGNVEQAQAAGLAIAQRFREAKNLYESGGAMTSGDPDVLAGYADVLVQTGDYDVAANAYREAARYAPESPTLWLNLGRALAKLGTAHAREARDAFAKCIELGGGDAVTAQAHFEWGELYAELGLYDFAEREYERALDITPGDPVITISLAAVYARRAEVERAEGLLSTVPTPYSSVMQQKVRKALRDFDRARMWFSDSAENHLAYARLLIRGAEPERALMALERSIALDDTDYVAWNLLGSIARGLGDTERAREAFRRSLEIDPDQPRTQEALNALPSVEQ